MGTYIIDGHNVELPFESLTAGDLKKQIDLPPSRCLAIFSDSVEKLSSPYEALLKLAYALICFQQCDRLSVFG